MAIGYLVTQSAIPQNGGPSDLAIIVTCHGPYLDFLPQALESIEQQVWGSVERIVVFDGCAAPPAISDGWTAVVGNWQDPPVARNAGAGATSAPWLIFVDADNVLPSGYLSAARRTIARAGPEVAIAYPDIQYTDEALNPTKLWQMPAWDYWSLRRQNYIDTSSAWQRDAIELVGGWPVGGESHDDFRLALAITAAGWKATRLDGPPILMREHGDSRRPRVRKRDGALLTDIWRARSLGIVSLMAERESTLDRWKRFLLTAELRPNTGLYVVDYSASPRFARRLYDACELIAVRRSLTQLDVAATGRPFRIEPTDPHLTKSRHLHVARLYAEALMRMTEGSVLTLEDDLEPPPDAIRRLGEELGYPSRANIGVVAGAYSSPHSPTHVCAGLGSETWGRSVRWEALPREPIDVACVGGGCALWGNWALRECDPHIQWDRKLGWDGVVCRALRRNDYRVLLHGGVRCHHHARGQTQDVPQFASAPVVTPRAAPPRAGSIRG